MIFLASHRVATPPPIDNVEMFATLEPARRVRVLACFPDRGFGITRQANNLKPVLNPKQCGVDAGR